MSLEDYINTPLTLEELKEIDIDDCADALIKKIEEQIEYADDRQNYLFSLNSFDRCGYCILGKNEELLEIRAENRYKSATDSSFVYLLNIWFGRLHGDYEGHCNYRQYNNYEPSITAAEDLKNYDETNNGRHLVFACVKALFHRDVELIPAIRRALLNSVDDVRVGPVAVGTLLVIRLLKELDKRF